MFKRATKQHKKLPEKNAFASSPLILMPSIASSCLEKLASADPAVFGHLMGWGTIKPDLLYISIKDVSG